MKPDSAQLSELELVIAAEIAGAMGRILSSWQLPLRDNFAEYVENSDLTLSDKAQIFGELATTAEVIYTLMTVPHSVLLALMDHPLNIWAYAIVGSRLPLIGGATLKLLKTRRVSLTVPYVERAVSFLIDGRPIAVIKPGPDFISESLKMYQEMIKHAIHPEGKLPERVAPNGIRSASAQEVTDAMRAVLEEYGLPDIIAGLKETPAGTLTQAQGAVDTAENILRKRVHLWDVAFDGSERVPLKDLKGVRMIAYLVAHPGEAVEALRLMQLASGASSDDTRIPRRQQLGATSGMSADPFGSSRDERLTRKDIVDLRRRKAREEKGKALAERLDNQEKAARLAESIASIDKMLKRDLALGGKPRTIDTDRDRARSAVAKDLTRALKHIGDANPHLAMHLKNSLRVGETCCYVPSPPVEWATN
jgi:hypothetical protein